MVTAVLSLNKRFKPFQRDAQLKSIFKDIVSQNNLKGFLIFNFSNERKSFIVRQSHDVIRQAARVASVGWIRNPFNHKKYTRNVSRFGIANPNDFYIHHYLAIGGDTYAIIIIDDKYLMKMSALCTRISAIFSAYHTRQGVSKTLLIAIVDKKFTKYKQLFARSPRKLMYNVHILEARRNWKGKRESFRYTLISWNPFRSTCRRQTVKRGVRFFPTLRNDLNGRRFVVRTLFDSLPTLNDLKRNWATPPVILPDKYPFETAVAMLNASCNFKLEGTYNSLRYWDFEFTTANFFFRKNITLNSTLLYPTYGTALYFMAPSFYDARTQTCLDSLLSCFIMILVLIFTFWAFSRLHGFDLLTWEPIVLFSMIISSANPRNPIRPGETVMFLCLISVGFFVGSDLIFGMTSTVISKSEERPVETLEDIVRYDLTMYECWIHYHNESWDPELLSKLKLYNLLDKPITWDQDFKTMLLYKNISLSTVVLMCAKIPQNIMIQGTVYARLTYIKECIWGVAAITQCNKPWVDQLYINLLRFYENNLLSYPYMEYVRERTYRYYVRDTLEDLEMKFQSEVEEKSVVELGNFWMIIVAGFTLPILLLIIERSVSSCICFVKV